MSTGRWLAAGLAVLLAGGVLGYCARGSGGAEVEKEEAARQVARAEEADRQAEWWKDLAETYAGIVASRDSAAREDSIARAAELDRLRRQASGLSRRLRASLDSAQAAILDSLEVAHALEVFQHEEAKADLRGRLRVRDSQILTLTRTVTEMENSRDRWRDSVVSAKDDVIAKLERKDISILGLRLDVTFGATGACGVGFRGPDCVVGAGVSIGR